MRLCDGDPLELGPRSEARVEELAFFIATQRVVNRAAARVAHAGLRYRGTPPLHEFLRSRIDVAIRELLEEDRESVTSGSPGHPRDDDPATIVAARLVLDRDLARLVCLGINLLSAKERRVCHALILRGSSLNQCSRAGLGAPDDVLATLRTSIATVSRRIGRPLSLDTWRMENGGPDER